MPTPPGRAMAVRTQEGKAGFIYHSKMRLAKSTAGRPSSLPRVPNTHSARRETDLGEGPPLIPIFVNDPSVSRPGTETCGGAKLAVASGVFIIRPRQMVPAVRPGANSLSFPCLRFPNCKAGLVRARPRAVGRQREGN